MSHYYVLYDEHCALCGLCRDWVERQRQYVPLVFLPAGARATREQLPDLVLPPVPEELIVVSDEGCVYRESSAWIVLLWALEDYRPLAHRLASPRRLAMANRVVKGLASRRGALSRLVPRAGRARCSAGVGACGPDQPNLVEVDEW